MKLKLVILLLAFSIFHSFAAPIKFYSINTLHGISVRATNSICKDINGFIWVSSKTGILRLTDDDYRIYQLNYANSGAIIVNLTFENGHLIAYTNNGQIFSYNPILDRFDLVLNIGNYINGFHFDVYNLLIDKSNRFWIALSTGLYLFHEGLLTFVDEISDEKYSLTWYDSDNILFSTGKGIWIYDIGKQERKSVFEIKNNRPFSVSSLFLDTKQNKLWIGTMASGLYMYDFFSGNFMHVLKSQIPTQPILALEENSDSTLLVGIDGQGLWELSKDGLSLLNVFKENDEDPHSLRGNGVYDIFYEYGKRVWVCTISGGVSFYELSSPFVTQVMHNANNRNSLVNNEVNYIIEDKNGKIWFATNNGISCWNVETGQWSAYYNNKLEQAQVFLTLCEDDHGRIWAGSYSSGFYVLDAKTGRELAHYFRNDSNLVAISNYIFKIYKDSEGDLWIGGVNGHFVRYISKENIFQTYFDEPVSSFFELEPGQILVGLSYGLSLLDKRTGQMKSLLTGIVVQEIFVENDVVWICTSGEGLLKYNHKNGNIEKYNTDAGLPSNFINSISLADGYLWLGTENGLCRFNPNDGTIITFQSIFPLSSISYNKSAVHKLRNGHLAWGTNSGAVLFSTESLKEITSEGKIFFQDIYISGRSIRDIPSFALQIPVNELNSLNLKYFQNTINVELLPIGVPSGTKFSWKLEGFDKEWNTPTESRIITYTNLPSGRFTLKIRLLDNSMSEIIDERTITIRLIPPYWRKSWFWGLLMIVILGFIGLYLLYYINNLKQKHAEEKIRFFTNTAHDIRTSLTLIKAPVEELSKETGLSPSGNYFLKLAIDQTRQLTSVINQLMDFQKVDIGKEQLLLSDVDIVKLVKTRILMFKSLADSKNISFNFNCNQEQYRSCVDESKMEKVIDNLISNAIKYSKPNSQIQFDLKCEKEKWIFQVKDQGIGISKKAQKKLFREFYRGENAINSKIVGSGIGLLLAKNYVSMHEGEISCESQENIGSTFKIEIPYKAISEIDTIKEKSDSVAESKLAGTTDLPIVLKQSPALSKSMKILIVEDNDDLLHFMKDALESEFNILIAEDGNTAWKYILKQLPDLVVSDIMMPGMDGFQLCKMLKSTYETSHIPIILLTALSEQSDQLYGLGLGADDYLTKPFEMSLLVQKIKTLIHNREIVKDKALKMINNTFDEPLLQNEHNDKFMKKILEVVRANISNVNFDKEEFARAMNVSSSLLYKKIKALTNLSPSDFVKTIRLNHAMELLQSSNYSVTEISELCGFSSVGYFSTVFKKHFGKSPTEV